MDIGNLGDLLQQIINKPLASATVVLNLIIIESLLSIDNAGVLAVMVMDLPKDQRSKALRYGILGAYVFRGICLLFAAMLIQIWWFKPLGGIYLMVLAGRYFFTKKNVQPLDEAKVLESEKRSWIYRKTLGFLGQFWATVVLVELMDLAFSIDNVIAANAYTSNIILIWTGVFIGILAMRFVAQGFVRLMEKYPFLDTCAYLVIGILGIKLGLSLIAHFYPCSAFAHYLEGDQMCLISQGIPLKADEHHFVWGDVVTSVLSIGIFCIPVLTSLLFNFPKRHAIKEEEEKT